MSGAILIVDDEATICSALSRLLGRQGFDTLTAETGEEALRLLGTSEVAVILCDEKMPGLSGVEVLTRAAALAPHAGRILLTGFPDPMVCAAAVNQGQVCHILWKPWTEEQLLLCVRQASWQYDLALGDD